MIPTLPSSSYGPKPTLIQFPTQTTQQYEVQRQPEPVQQFPIPQQEQPQQQYQFPVPQVKPQVWPQQFPRQQDIRPIPQHTSGY